MIALSNAAEARRREKCGNYEGEDKSSRNKVNLGTKNDESNESNERRQSSIHSLHWR